MALFERRESDRTQEYFSSLDAASRALSVTAVENDFVEDVYGKLASVYDWTFGPALHPGRLRAIQRMGLRPGDHILEVGVGTGINASLYPRVCRPGGRIVFLNHFRSSNFLLSRIERMISPFTIHVGFRADIDLPAFLAQAGIHGASIEKVNIPRIWSLVTCVKA